MSNLQNISNQAAQREKTAPDRTQVPANKVPNQLEQPLSPVAPGSTGTAVNSQGKPVANQPARG